MTYQYKIVACEKINDTDYKLITETKHCYFYRLIEPMHEPFASQEESWKKAVLLAQDTLFQWITNPVGLAPACICWNSEGYAMLEIHVGSNTEVSEINSFENKEEDWMLDEACPLPTKDIKLD
jgi:hypothetical protein